MNEPTVDTIDRVYYGFKSHAFQFTCFVNSWLDYTLKYYYFLNDDVIIKQTDILIRMHAIIFIVDHKIALKRNRNIAFTLHRYTQTMHATTKSIHLLEFSCYTIDNAWHWRRPVVVCKVIWSNLLINHNVHQSINLSKQLFCLVEISYGMVHTCIGSRKILLTNAIYIL